MERQSPEVESHVPERVVFDVDYKAGRIRQQHRSAGRDDQHELEEQIRARRAVVVKPVRDDEKHKAKHADTKEEDDHAAKQSAVLQFEAETHVFSIQIRKWPDRGEEHRVGDDERGEDQREGDIVVPRVPMHSHYGECAVDDVGVVVEVLGKHRGLGEVLEGCGGAVDPLSIAILGVYDPHAVIGDKVGKSPGMRVNRTVQRVRPVAPLAVMQMTRAIAPREVPHIVASLGTVIVAQAEPAFVGGGDSEDTVQRHLELAALKKAVHGVPQGVQRAELGNEEVNPSGRHAS